MRHRRWIAAVVTLLLVLAPASRHADAGGRRGQSPNEATVRKITEAVPTKARIQPAKPRKLLVLSYQSHTPARLCGEKALELMAEKTGAFEPTFVRDRARLPEV